MSPLVTCEQLSVVTNGYTRLALTDLEINKGLTIISGPSGSGKSTLLKTIYGLVRPTTGTVKHLDAEGNTRYENGAVEPAKLVKRLGRRFVLETKDEKRDSAYRSQYLGYIAQEPHLLGNLMIKDYITLGHESRGNVVDQARLQSLSAALGIEAIMEKYPATVSGGEQQRAAMAFALLHQPEVIFADEPTAALDSVNSEVTMDLLREKVDSEGLSVICVTHSPAVLEYADNVISISDGQVRS